MVGHPASRPAVLTATTSDQLRPPGESQILHDLAHNSGNENTRRQAIETVLKLHQVLKDQPAAPPSVTIVIQDPHMVAGSVNPILIPRDTTKQKETIQ